MADSGILQQALSISPCSAGEATHFALCNGGQMRYLVSLHRGAVSRLVRNVAAYGTKLRWLMRLLPLLPWRLLQAAHLGCYVRAVLHPELQKLTAAGTGWNLLVGTYDERQKLVLQYPSPEGERCLFAKIGNAASAPQMEAEIDFLRRPHGQERSFRVPEIAGSSLMKEGAAFNVLITKEFSGTRIPAELTPDIYAIYREVSGEPQLREGELLSFSHGDFTPWNLRREERGYTLFDWEHCGLRPVGYDLLYYAVMLEIVFRHRRFEEAYAAALSEVRRFEPEFTMDKERFYALFSSVIKQLQY